MHKRVNVLLGFLLASAMLLPACSQARRGSQVAVEQSASKPDWLDTRPQSEDPLLFVGEVANAKDLSLATEQAEYEALKRIAGTIGQEINGEFSAMVKGSNKAELGARLGTTVESVVNARISQVTVRGAQTVQRWWARYETEATDGSLMTSYRVATLVKIPKKDYEQAKMRFVEELSGADQIKANSDAAQALDDFKTRLQNPK